MTSAPRSRLITSSAPIRICDNGGWTDTAVARWGKVFNIAVCPRAYVRIETFPAGAREGPVVMDAADYGERYVVPPARTNYGPHPLLEAALRRIPPPPGADVEITVGSQAPAGASTGTSAAVVVALLGALDRLENGQRTPMDIAKEAHAVETIELGRQSGVQDQLCSAFGGANFIEIAEYPRAIVTPLEWPARMRAALQRRLALIYLGRPHSSSAVHERVIRDLERLGPTCAPLEALRAAAEQARAAFCASDLDGLGRSMRANTEAQIALHPDLVQSDARRVIEIAAAHGALGWKVNGAGGDGGSITVLCDARPGARRALLCAIAEVSRSYVPIPIVMSRSGLRVSDVAEHLPT